MRICIFEDSYVTNLSPLNYFRHTSEFLCGAASLSGKINNYTGRKIKLSLHCRKYLQDYLREKHPDSKVNLLDNDDYLFLNSRVLYNNACIKNLLQKTKSGKNFLHTIDDNIIALFISRDNLAGIKNLIESDSDDNLLTYDKINNLNLTRINIDNPAKITLINYPWNLIEHHGNEIKEDLDFLFRVKRKRIKKIKGLETINGKDVYLSPKCIINPGVVLDASKGKIFISDFAKIEPFSFVQGPVYIGENSTIRSGAKIYGPVCIMNNSKISGEVVYSVIHSYVNKQHLGFLGHSYLCEWVNLGAGTTTSNLKNNYSSISVKWGGEPVNTGTTFLGSMIGDHTKTGINTMLTTGSIIGISSNVFGSGYLPKLIRSFSWLDADNKNTYLYEFEKALNTAKTSMMRRKCDMSKNYEELFGLLFKKIQENLL